LPSKEQTPELDGNHLYYGRTKWPQYEARFNLRLSYLYGPVIPIKLGPETLLGRVARWVSKTLCRDWKHSDTTILINSLSENDNDFRKFLGSCTSRSSSLSAGKYLSRGRRMVLQPYGPDWVRYRRAFASLLTKEKIHTRWARALRFEAMVMVDRIANLSSSPGPSDQTVLDEISRFTASSVLQITYARRAPTPHDQALRDLETVSQNIADAFTPGKYWVEDFPLLDIFPSVISPWKRKLNADHDFEMKLFRDLLHGLESKLGGERRNSEESIFDPQSAIAEGVIAPEECAAAELLRNRGHLKLDRDDICYLAAGIFEAGTETTAMTIDTFLLAAASYPNMTRQAQAEIDLMMDRKPCRGQAVPTLENLQHMPYLAAVVKETLRLTPPGSSGVGHTSIRAGPQFLELNNGSGEESMQLHIPPGATVLANTYGLHHNPHHFPNPWDFDPDRWLTSDTRCLSNSQDFASPTVSLDHTNAHYSFGFGRRICPGSTLASYSLSISIAMLLLCFDFELTDSARQHYIEMKRQQGEEQEKWKSLFPISGRDIVQEGLFSKVYGDETERIGRLLIDAHIAFKLSRSQLAECIRIQPRKQDHGVVAVRESLALRQNS
jgi:cytochrome P450